MRKLKLAMYVSVDGVVEDPAWTGPYWDDQLAQLQADYLFASDALVLGRVTYEGFASAWPSIEEATGEVGLKMNTRRIPAHDPSRRRRRRQAPLRRTARGQAATRRFDDHRHRRRRAHLRDRGGQRGVSGAVGEPPVTGYAPVDGVDVY